MRRPAVLVRTVRATLLKRHVAELLAYGVDELGRQGRRA
jgi:hypothetical protein